MPAQSSFSGNSYAAEILLIAWLIGISVFLLRTYPANHTRPRRVVLIALSFYGSLGLLVGVVSLLDSSGQGWLDLGGAVSQGLLFAAPGVVFAIGAFLPRSPLIALILWIRQRLGERRA